MVQDASDDDKDMGKKRIGTYQIVAAGTRFVEYLNFLNFASLLEKWAIDDACQPTVI
jgi:hypothetical protein